jgi:transcriptional regulator with XRE-family HTH domain
MTIGERIAEERKFAGLTQKELGAQTGIDHRQFANTNPGDLTPKLKQ